ncbi:MAG: hypothetical protein KatS3mg129_1675 [Leptospiraceae bacterium]|nr:MAG: hypothetical protein KatS3mg129_1675 [Leptospiraceae bacterium]
MKDSEFLVILDLDSLIYHKNNWRVINPLIGRVGSSVDLIWVMNFYLENRNRKDFNLFNYCIPDVMEIPSISSLQIQKEQFNIMPIEKIQEAILQHKIRGRKIYFITLLLDEKIKEIIINKIYNYNKNTKEIFDKIQWKEYWITPSINKIKSYEYPQFTKLLFLKRIIKTINTNEQINWDLTIREKFKRIFYYTTDISMIELIRQYFLENRNNYEFRQNTVISYLIARIQN